MYAQEIGRMALEPQGAALMVPSELPLLTDCMGTTGWLGRKGARWAFLLGQDMHRKGAPPLIPQVLTAELVGANPHASPTRPDSHSDGTHARSTSTVGDAERLVQIKMRHVRTVVCWPAQSHLTGERVGLAK